MIGEEKSYLMNLALNDIGEIECPYQKIIIKKNVTAKRGKDMQDISLIRNENGKLCSKWN